MSAQRRTTALAALAATEAALKARFGANFTSNLGGATGLANIFTCQEIACQRVTKSTSEMERHLGKAWHQAMVARRVAAQQAAPAPAPAPPAPAPAPIVGGGLGAPMGGNQLHQQPNHFGAAAPAAGGNKTEEEEEGNEDEDDDIGGGFGGRRNGFRGGLFEAPSPISLAGQPQYQFY